MLVFNNIANKLLRILCGMIKNKPPYIENYQSVLPRLRQAGTRAEAIRATQIVFLSGSAYHCRGYTYLTP